MKVKGNYVHHYSNNVIKTCKNLPKSLSEKKLRLCYLDVGFLYMHNNNNAQIITGSTFFNRNSLFILENLM